jgi:NRPS condensation-like uncharacterized protein
MGIVFEDDRLSYTTSNNQINDHTLKKVRKFAEYFADLAMKSGDFLTLKPSVVATGCILCARLVNKITPLWNRVFDELIGGINFRNDGI